MSGRQGAKSRRDELARAWSAFMSGEDPALVRAEILASWRRTVTVLSPELAAAPIGSLETDHEPLLKAARRLDLEFKATMADSGVVLGLTDARGQIVWTTGEPRLLTLSGRVNFVPGALWDEAHMGVNAISLALTSGRPSTVWATEHWSPSLQVLSCYAAPIRHPQTGRRLGVLDLSTAWNKDQPLASTVVVALAERLATEIAAHSSGSPDADAEELVLHVLGEHRAALGGCAVALTRRQTEIALLLALRPEGTPLEQLHADLYGDEPVAVDTLKAEVSHLRRALGGRISRAPYRICGRVTVDALDLLMDLRKGRTLDATHRFGGPVLPWSESPRIVRLARTVEVALRDAVLAETDPETALTLAVRLDDDAALVEHVLRILPPGDSRRHVMRGHLASIA